MKKEGLTCITINSVLFLLIIVFADTLLIQFVFPTPTGNVNGSSIYVNLSSSGGRHYSFVDFDYDLLLWMRMDDSNGSTVFDNSSYGMNGALKNGALVNVSGLYGSAFEGDGHDNYIEVPDSSIFDSIANNDELTVCAWVYRYSNFNDYGDNQGILGQYWSTGDYDYNNKSFSIAEGITAGQGGYGFYVSADGSAWQDAYTNSAVPLNEWHHLCGVVEDDGTVKLYLDAVVQTNTGNVLEIYNPQNTPFTIGTYLYAPVGQGNSTLFFNGSIDEVLLFDRSLSLNEIRAIYNSSQYHFEHNYTNLQNGSHTFIGYAVNISGNVGSVSRTISTGVIEGTLIEFVSPTETSGQTLSRDYIKINTTSSLVNFSNITINVYNSSSLVNSTISLTSPIFLRVDNLSNTDYYFNATACNTSQCNSTETRNVTILVTGETPNITLISSTYQENDFLIQINTSVSASICWFTANNGTTNTTMFEQSTTKFYYEDFNYGTPHLKFYCQNQYGTETLEENFEFRRTVVYEDVYYTNSHGLKIYFDFVFNYTAEKGPLVVIPDSWTAVKDTTWVTDAENFYLQRGYAASPVNTRGKGSSEGTKDAFGYECLDIYELVQELLNNPQYSPFINSSSVYISGASGAGGKAGVCTAKYPDTFTSGYSSVGVLNLTKWWYTAAGADVAEIEVRVGCTPLVCPEAYLARDASYLVYNTQSTVRTVSNADDDRVTVNCSRDYNSSSTYYNKNSSYIEYSSGGHSANFVDSESWFDYHTGQVFIPLKGDFIIGGYVHTKNFSIYLGNVSAMGNVWYDLSNINKYLNVSTSSYSGTANITLYGLTPNIQYSIEVNESRTYLTSSSTGVLSFSQNISPTLVVIIISPPYCGNGICSNGETCSSCSQDCGSCSSGGGSGGGGGGGTKTTIISNVSIFYDIIIAPIKSLIINPGENQKFTLNVKNNGNSFLNDCKVIGKGNYSYWIQSTETRGLGAGEKHDFVFTLIVPDELNEIIYNIELSLICHEFNKSSSFTAEVLEEKIKINLVEALKQNKNKLKIVYSLEELSGNNQDIEIEIILFGDNNKKLAEFTETRYIDANSLREFETILEIPNNLAGTFNLLLNVLSPITSTFVQESIILGDRDISGFAVFDNSKSEILLIIALTFIFAMFVYFTLKRICKLKKQHKIIKLKEYINEKERTDRENKNF